jgi:hypothetical protein
MVAIYLRAAGVRILLTTPVVIAAVVLLLDLAQS